jgi:hypothetical protein
MKKFFFHAEFFYISSKKKGKRRWTGRGKMAYGTVHAGKLVLYDQTISISDVDISNVKFANLDINEKGRLRTSDQKQEFSFCGSQVSRVQQITSGNGSISQSNGSFYMNVINAGDVSKLESYQYFPANTSNRTVSITAALTGDLSQLTGICSRLGLFDDTNGFFFQLKNGTLYAVVRKNGTDVETAQASFTQDTLTSTIVFSPGTIYSFIIDIQRDANLARFELFAKGMMILAHTIEGGNVPVIADFHLPLRCEIQNISSNTVTGNALVMNASVTSDNVPYLHPFAYSTPTRTVTTGSTLMSLKQGGKTFVKIKELNGYANIPTLLQVFEGTSILNPTWSSIENDSISIDVSGVASSGKLIHSGVYHNTFTIPFERELYQQKNLSIVVQSVDNTSVITCILGVQFLLE